MNKNGGPIHTLLEIKEENPPPREKDKVEKTEDGQSEKKDDADTLYSFDSDDELSLMGQITLQKYYAQVEESEGFDVFVNVYFMGSIAPLLNFQKDPVKEAFITGLAELAIAHYNQTTRKKNERYYVVEVERANEQCVAGSMYYITFKARNTKLRAAAARNPNGVEASTLKTFQAKVWERIKPKDPEVLFCRLKPVAN